MYLCACFTNHINPRTQMKKVLLSIIIATIFGFSANSQVGGTWEKLNVGSSVIQTAIDFPGNQNMVGYTASMSLTYNGNGNIFKTTDGGTTWTSIWYGTKAGFEGMCFTGIDTGYVAGSPSSSISWSGFGKTVNGGQTWTSMAVPAGVYTFKDVLFRDANHGILLAQTNSSAAVYVTGDGGNTWQTATGINGVPDRACYLSGTTWFLVDNGGRIKKSTDDGHTWTTVYPGGDILLGITFFNAMKGEACGDNGKILRTTDGGNTWQVQTVTSNIWHQVAYEDENNIFAVGTPEIIYKSTNGGNSWSNNYPQSTYNNAFYDIQILPNGTAWVCGSGGVLMRRYQLVQANFTANNDTVCRWDEVQFTSTSAGSNLQYSWFFEGGTPATSSAQDPVVQYNTPGTYGVKLVVTNGILTDSVYRSGYITVKQSPPAPVITDNGGQLSSNSVFGNQWYRDGNLIAAATSQTYTPVQTGWYWDVISLDGCVSDTSNNIYKLFVGTGLVQNESFSVFPSPSHGRFTLDIPSELSGIWDLEVINLMGSVVYRSELRTAESGNRITIDLGTPQAGLYTLLLRKGDSFERLQILID